MRSSGGHPSLDTEGRWWRERQARQQQQAQELREQLQLEEVKARRREAGEWRRQRQAAGNEQGDRGSAGEATAAARSSGSSSGSSQAGSGKGGGRRAGLEQRLSPAEYKRLLTQRGVDCRGWRLVVTGHSLGAAVAALVAVHLREQFPGGCSPGCTGGAHEELKHAEGVLELAGGHSSGEGAGQMS